MKRPSSLKKWAAALALAAGIGSAQAQVASLDAATNTMRINSLAVAGQYWTGLNIYLPPAQVWYLQGTATPVSPLLASDSATYDFSSSQLWLPLTQIGTTIYSDMKLNLPVGGTWSIIDAGNVVSTGTEGYDMTFPIRSLVRNSHNDAGGELTYTLTNGQVWKHLADEPCMTAAAIADPTGYSEVEIYPNPGGSGSVATSEGNFRFVSYYPSKDAAVAVETCIVGPVFGVFNTPAATSLNQLAVAPTTLSGALTQRFNAYISGGTPPYFVTTDNPGVTTFRLLAQDPTRSGQTLEVLMKRAGSAILTIFDYNRTATTLTVTSGTNFIAIPTNIDATAGTDWQVMFSGGTPPYRLYHNPSPVSLSVSSITAATATFPAYATVRLLKSPGDLEMPVMFIDAAGTLLNVPVKIKAGTVVPTPGGALGSGGTSIFK